MLQKVSVGAIAIGFYMCVLNWAWQTRLNWSDLQKHPDITLLPASKGHITANQAPSNISAYTFTQPAANSLTITGPLGACIITQTTPAGSLSLLHVFLQAGKVAIYAGSMQNGTYSATSAAVSIQGNCASVDVLSGIQQYIYLGTLSDGGIAGVQLPDYLAAVLLPYTLGSVQKTLITSPKGVFEGFYPFNQSLIP